MFPPYPKRNDAVIPRHSLLYRFELLLVVVHFVVGLDVAVGVRAGVRSARTRLTVLRRLLLIDLAEDFVGNLVGLFHLRLNGLDIAAVLCLAQLCNSILDLGLVGRIDLIAQILQSLLDLVSGRVRIVDGLDLLLVLLILIRVLLRIIAVTRPL